MRAPTLLASFLATTALVVASPAMASTSYPQVLSDTLEMPCVPLCTVCHSTVAGGIGTVVTTFGKKAMELGAKGLTKGGSDQLLVTTLNTMRSMSVNSDTDPDIDVDELAYGGDPSVAGGDVCRGPKFGCGASVAAPAKRSTDHTAAAAAVLTALVGLLALRRRRH